MFMEKHPIWKNKSHKYRESNFRFMITSEIIFIVPRRVVIQKLTFPIHQGPDSAARLRLCLWKLESLQEKNNAAKNIFFFRFPPSNRTFHTLADGAPPAVAHRLTLTLLSRLAAQSGGGLLCGSAVYSSTKGGGDRIASSVSWAAACGVFLLSRAVAISLHLSRVPVIFWEIYLFIWATTCVFLAFHLLSPHALLCILLFFLSPPLSRSRGVALIRTEMEKYEVVKDLGTGNFGVARLMRNKDTNEFVAMKYIPRGQKVGFLFCFVSASF